MDVQNLLRSDSSLLEDNVLRRAFISKGLQDENGLRHTILDFYGRWNTINNIDVQI